MQTIFIPLTSTQLLPQISGRATRAKLVGIASIRTSKRRHIYILQNYMVLIYSKDTQF